MKTLKILLLSSLCIISTKFFGQEYEVQEFTVNASTHQLAGEIYKSHQVGNHQLPVVIFVVGSKESSFRTNYQSFWKFFLEDLVREGKMILVNFDKRGIGKSTGNWAKTNFEQRTEDVKSIADYVKSLPFVDASQIYLVGHSQGGWIVQNALIHYPNEFAGAVSMAGATFSVKKQLINDFQSEFICKENLESEKAYRKAKSKTNRILLFTSLFPIQPNWKQLRRIKRFDIQNELHQIQKPLFYMWGENDPLVNYKWAEDALNQAFHHKIPTHIQTYLGENQNHSFQESDFCPEPNKSPLEYSETSKMALKNWLITQFSVH